MEEQNLQNIRDALHIEDELIKNKDVKDLFLLYAYEMSEWTDTIEDVDFITYEAKHVFTDLEIEATRQLLSSFMTCYFRDYNHFIETYHTMIINLIVSGLDTHGLEKKHYEKLLSEIENVLKDLDVEEVYLMKRATSLIKYIEAVIETLYKDKSYSLTLDTVERVSDIRVTASSEEEAIKLIKRKIKKMSLTLKEKR